MDMEREIGEREGKMPPKDYPPRKRRLEVAVSGVLSTFQRLLGIKTWAVIHLSDFTREYARRVAVEGLPKKSPTPILCLAPAEVYLAALVT